MLIGFSRIALLSVLILAPGIGAAQQTDNARCPAAFQHYEAAVRSFGAVANRGNRTVPPGVMDAARRLRMNGCLTFSAALEPMDQIQPSAPAPSGSAIRPTQLHVGIVTSTADDERTRAFFTRMGIPVRTVGAAMLGRRVYIGPFTTSGALEDGRDLAIRAGFAYPYPARF